MRKLSLKFVAFYIIVENDVIATVYEKKIRRALPVQQCRKWIDTYNGNVADTVMAVCLFVVLLIAILFVMHSLFSISSSPLPVDEAFHPMKCIKY